MKMRTLITMLVCLVGMSCKQQSLCSDYNFEIGKSSDVVMNWELGKWSVDTNNFQLSCFLDFVNNLNNIEYLEIRIKTINLTTSENLSYKRVLAFRDFLLSKSKINGDRIIIHYESLFYPELKNEYSEEQIDSLFMEMDKINILPSKEMFSKTDLPPKAYFNEVYIIAKE